ncbi:hypothetical protein [uncultured Nocardioides sp.]|uniref:Uncharacterized protein n=1 Tax=uncultured Nocardioides sp. TaxID=198441 RepID=A0A6J4PH04_9ACTN|nr:hypothetical protein [uncultured Nocardioides sp.]CAA9415272.1 MAG: hypothetical protein AVDCRST_MAG06-3146 [uncultured Nocardioides sp.]
MAPTTSELPDTAAAVLGYARSRRAAADRAEAELLVAACQWADLHPASEDYATTFTMPGGGEHEEPVAAKRLIGQAL